MRRTFPLLLAVAAFLVAALVWIGNSGAARQTFEFASSLNTSPRGLSLAAAYLARTGHPTTTLTRPLRPGAARATAVVFRVLEHGANDEIDIEVDDDMPAPAKARTPPRLLSAAEEDWVRGGGRLVLATSRAAAIEVRGDAGRKAVRVFPIWPAIDAIALPEGRGIAARSLPRGMHTLYAANGESVVARQFLGRGEVFLIAAPELFENRHLAIDKHLALLGALAGAAGRPVLFDEAAHGVVADEGALTILTEWRLGPLLAVIAIASLLAFWRNARRIGPPEDDDRDTRSDAVDLVNSLGALYGNAMTDDEALALYRDVLARSVAAQQGLRGDALHRRVADLTRGTGQPRGTRGTAFQQQLAIINDAFRALERAHAGGSDANRR